MEIESFFYGLSIMANSQKNIKLIKSQNSQSKQDEMFNFSRQALMLKMKRFLSNAKCFVYQTTLKKLLKQF